MNTMTTTVDAGLPAIQKSSGAAGPRRGRPGRPGRAGRAWLPYLLLLPALVLELLVHLVPMVIGAVMSLKEITQFYIRNWTAAPWSGFDNYRIAVDFDAPVGEALLHSFVVTVGFTLLSVALCWLIGTAAAICLQDGFRGRGLLRTLFLVPYALPVYAAVITWVFMFQHDNGLVNHVLHDQLHLTDEPSFWLIGDNSFWALLTVSVWKGWPFAFLIVMAGLQNIPRELYEAAALDGAGMWQQIRRITLPSLRPVNQVLVLVLFLWTFNDFNTPYVMFGKAAPQAADLISVHIYQASFVSWDFGTGSAMSVLLLLFLLVVTGVYLAVTSRGRRSADV
ncbi:ABC transporter permease [Streptomyces thermoviolaceus subsp. thermoviolaceus]|uniref:Sugar ABC transporter permease n=2 Tax=Streptomyces thermoviolaceus TaxID=1952 RepID=A0ABX0YXA9_STRTL|nr:sugar ABC transporter permease [Streptomyces thermoviolaceus subsp. thermoviolaceus]GGV76955.1 ABC transporter permease [Streptomyces thermoviolaceus subsp. apingens]GHB03387.1 ABC transporter permease [Streptomyces thermoviolaceus subsp. thermoviolaceus]